MKASLLAKSVEVDSEGVGKTAPKVLVLLATARQALYTYATVA